MDAHNVFPPDVEEPLLAHPTVRTAVMFAATGPDRLQRAHAAVTVLPGSGVTAEQLHRWVRDRRGPLCDPATILVLPDILPTGTGKPDLGALRAPAVPPGAHAPE
ncbi:AMP-binding enzyme [Streptomyces sp. BE303]|uniref:AMP-binding enzyme n=1 Tax=Streptomyces sp. BE303 TaxID=3002528 RepID=UPI002E7A26EB|nr:hypothetical protein [Streptomyces sp. BE303]MED7952018.1 hypothetical protein [Streptomyces sp. BE303]